MVHSRGFYFLALSAALLGSACIADSSRTDQDEASSDGTVVRMLPLRGAELRVQRAAPAATGLTYWGGPTLRNISVHPVF